MSLNSAADVYCVYSDALMLMGTPVASSAISTVATALPLWLTATVALRQFAAVIAISLSLSFVYTLLMLIPLLGMFGPNKPKHLSEDEVSGIAGYGFVRNALSSVTVRGGVACALSLIVMVRSVLLVSSRVILRSRLQ